MIASKDEGVSPQSWNRSGTRRTSRWPAAEAEGLHSTVERAQDWLLERQDDEGYWVAELEGDTILESEYVLLMTFLGRESDPVCGRCARYIQDHQLPGGGWAIYPGGPVDISASVKAYFALKLTGHSPDEPEMVRARRAILEAGGAQACNSFTRFYLALLGQIGYDECPCVPPELVLIPHRWKFSLSAMSAWTRHDRGAALDHVVLQAGPPPVPGAGHRRTVRGGSPGAAKRPPGVMDAVLPGPRRRLEVARPSRARGVPPSRHPGGAPLDDGAFRGHRRPGSDLPADGLRHHRAQVAGLRRRLARGPLVARAARGPAHH